MKPEEREELLAAYALGTLSAPDAADVEALVASDPGAQADLAAYGDLVNLIALSVPLRRADPSLRDRVMKAARSEARRRPRRSIRMPAYLPAAAMAAGLVLLVVWVVQLQSTIEGLRRDTAALSAVVQSDARRLDRLVAGDTARTSALGVELATALQEQQIVTAVQTDPKVVSTELESTASGHGAGGHYLWSPSAGASVIVAHDLPPLPFGAVYRVWLEDRFSRLIGNTTFIPDERGNAQVVLRSSSSEEPVRLYVVATSDGGTSTVDGPVVLQGELRR